MHIRTEYLDMFRWNLDRRRRFSMRKNFMDLIWDYIVFIIVVLITTIVPLLGRYFGKKNESSAKADYVFAAGSSISIISMMLSVARGTLGVRSFLGYPSEIFYRGSGMWETLYGMVNAYPIVIFVFIPVYFSLGITSVYQYIEQRFNSRLVRCMASATYVFRAILNQSVTVYTPTVALYTIIGIPIWISLVGITVISIIFNLCGGLKATVQADVIQVIITIIVSVVIIIQSTILAGGPKKVYDVNNDSGRLDFFNFTGDLTIRVDTTSAWLGQLFMSLSLFGCQQNFVQRYLSMKSIKHVRRMLMYNIPVIIVLFSLCWVVGMGIYAVYADCDPMKSGYINKPDAILPFYVEDKLAVFPGLMGIFLATLFNSALILNVSNLNSLATVTWEDFFSHHPQFKGMSDKKQLYIIKFIGTVFGLMIMGVGFLVGLLSGVIESSLLMTSATSGPLLGAFLLAILIPVANWKGTAAGMITSHIVTLYITFGRLWLNPPTEFLETSITGCTNETFSREMIKPGSDMVFNLPQNVEIPYWRTSTMLHSTTTETTPVISSYTFPENVYAVSYMYYSLIGTFITVIVGTIVSYFTFTRDNAYESKLIHPVVYKLCMLVPGTSKYFSDHYDQSDIIAENSKRSSYCSGTCNASLEVKPDKIADIQTINENINQDQKTKQCVDKCDLKKTENVNLDKPTT